MSQKEIQLVELPRFLLALKKTLDSKHQLLTYLKEQILIETELNLKKVTREEIDIYLRIK